MVPSETIERFIELTDQQLQLLHRLDNTYSDLLHTTSIIREESKDSQFETSIVTIGKWIFTTSTHIRRRIEALEIHREHLVWWYYNGLLGSEDW